jgi:hypothetical protein
LTSKYIYICICTIIFPYDPICVFM